jgi:hypothetical protein
MQYIKKILFLVYLLSTKQLHASFIEKILLAPIEQQDLDAYSKNQEEIQGNYPSGDSFIKLVTYGTEMLNPSFTRGWLAYGTINEKSRENLDNKNSSFLKLFLKEYASHIALNMLTHTVAPYMIDPEKLQNPEFSMDASDGEHYFKEKEEAFTSLGNGVLLSLRKVPSKKLALGTGILSFAAYNGVEDY